MGVDVQRAEFENGKWSYLRGEQRFGGWWWYYVYALAVKTPVGTLSLFVLAFATRACSGVPRCAVRSEIFLLAPAATILVLVSAQTGFNRYLRYVLPAVPFLYVWMSRVALVFEPSALNRRSWRHAARAGVLACLAALTVDSLSVWPHSMCYFNTVVGGAYEGHRHLLDANIDWGQDLLDLKRWTEKQSLTEPLIVSYFGCVDPQFAGIDAPRIPPLAFDDRGHVASGDLDDVRMAWYAVSVNHLMGYRHDKSDRPYMTWLREFTPIDRAGYSIWIFYLTEQDVEAFRQRHGQGRSDPSARP
jgi:hypothetical protein